MSLQRPIVFNDKHVIIARGEEAIEKLIKILNK